jgi:hypothetical protein
MFRGGTIKVGDPSDNDDGITIFPKMGLWGEPYIILDYTLFYQVNTIEGETIEEMLESGGTGLVNLLATLAHELWHLNYDPTAKKMFAGHNDQSFEFEAFFLVDLSKHVMNDRMLYEIWKIFAVVWHKLPGSWASDPSLRPRMPKAEKYRRAVESLLPSLRPAPGQRKHLDGPVGCPKYYAP